MKRFLALTLALAAVDGSQAQSSLQRHPDGLYLVISNPPPSFRLQWAPDLVTWRDYIVKPGPEPVQVVEVRIGRTNDAQFWRVLPLDGTNASQR